MPPWSATSLTRLALRYKLSLDPGKNIVSTWLSERDLFVRAQKLAKDFNITEAEARQWLSQRDVDIVTPQQAKPDVEHDVKDNNDDDVTISPNDDDEETEVEDMTKDKQ